MIKKYYLLTKPGIIRGNIFTTAAGFFLASKGHIDWWLLFATLAGVALVIAAACVFNNYIDREIDKKMARTKKRALVTGTISGKYALTYATILGLLGFVVLGLFTNFLTTLLGFIALVFYVVIYGYAKRHSVHGTLVGTVPGALPPVAGYVAVANQLDGGALILFLILVFWQMPHFYAIAMYRKDDYAAAKIPVLPIVHGMRATKIQIAMYVLAFIVAAVSLVLFGYAGYVYLAPVLVLGLMWLRMGVYGFNTKDEIKWARKMFGFSLIVLSALCVVLSLDATL